MRKSSFSFILYKFLRVFNRENQLFLQIIENQKNSVGYQCNSFDQFGQMEKK